MEPFYKKMLNQSVLCEELWGLKESHESANKQTEVNVQSQVSLTS